jgi:cytochrome c peroxidase
MYKKINSAAWLVKIFLLILCSGLIVLSFMADLWAENNSLRINPSKRTGYSIVDSAAFEELGELLFSDARFSSPDGKLSGYDKDKFSQFRISCKSCHMVDEKLKEKGMRGYTDFERRSPVPYRDGDKELKLFTNRRTQQLINTTGRGLGAASMYHWDGEFNEKNEHASLVKLIETTFISRNMGWRPGEENKANLLRLKTILDLDGFSAGENNSERISYFEMYCKSLGLTKTEFFELGEETILNICNEAIAFYIENIKSDIKSAYDFFLLENGISPETADENQVNEILKSSDLKYINKYVAVENSSVITKRKVKFGKKELRGLEIFMNKEKSNCSFCHKPPSFTDNKFHNIGVSEFDYKQIHGVYPEMYIDDKAISLTLNTQPPEKLKEIFQVYPKKENISFIDLGRGLFNGSETDYCAFRTPTIRNLKYCNPYFHSGRAQTIEEAITHHYRAAQQRLKIKHLSPNLRDSELTKDEISSLAAFIASLNDHYE